MDKLGFDEKRLLEDEIRDLLELNEYAKIKTADDLPSVKGTKTDRIDGILDRISLLREGFKLKHMFSKNSKNNIDFAQELEKGKVIIVKMPQDAYKKHSKNVIVTFLLSKIWIDAELKGRLNEKPKKTHIANNEILTQTRKFGCKFILSCQYTSQIEILMDTLIGAGASFMLMGGTNEKDFKRFEANLDNFEYEDLKEMKQYSSMNLIYYSGGYASFITALPKPIK